VFISIGDAEKLSIFLSANPQAPKELFLVDNYNLNAYNTMGFGKIGEDVALAIKGTKNMKAPQLEKDQWSSYFKLVNSLAPKDIKSVFRLGGTICVDGEKVLSIYEEGVPGDQPDVDALIRSLSSF
jgi:hypothetical protein